MSGQQVRAAWKRANRLAGCMEDDMGSDECPIVTRDPGCYTDEWWRFGHNGLASLALDGLTVAQVTREERRRGR